MLNRSGLIVLEGLDGSGKSTQFERLSAYFSENDIKHKAISFPDYDNPSSALVKMYLNGEIGKTPADVNAYAASSFTLLTDTLATNNFGSMTIKREVLYLQRDMLRQTAFIR